MSAWVDELGSPSRQVMRFQPIAPPSAAAISARPAKPVAGVVTLWIVLATPLPVQYPMNAPMKLKTAAKPSATVGVNARVPTDVAIAFAASWKPFVKSNPTAMTTTTMVAMSAASIRFP